MSEPNRIRRDVTSDAGETGDGRGADAGETGPKRGAGETGDERLTVADRVAHPRGDVADDSAYRVCRAALRYAREREYTGWDYADGLSSAFVRRLPFENKWLNLLVQEGIKRAPINLRPLFLVDQRRSYKGAALFAMANLDLLALSGEDRYAREAETLVEWLLEAEIDGYSGFCGGGHRHPLQSLDRPKSTTPGAVPGVVSTSYAVRALLRFAETFDRPTYVDYARTAAEFVRTDLEFAETDVGAQIKYTPTDGETYTLNANALGARLLLDLYDRFGDPKLLDDAEAILDYVATKQTATGGWMYTDPPTASHLSMDSYHNGFILESLLRHREVTGTDRHDAASDRYETASDRHGATADRYETASNRHDATSDPYETASDRHDATSDRYDETIDSARSFYRGLFRADGAPDWDESSAYPRDVHAAAQGIVVFSHLGEFALARTIIDWTLDALYAGDGQFYYQKRRFYTKRFTLMRWCQAWMAYALSTYLTEKYER